MKPVTNPSHDPAKVMPEIHHVEKPKNEEELEELALYKSPPDVQKAIAYAVRFFV
jgi:hypothetical protein